MNLTQYHLRVVDFTLTLVVFLYYNNLLQNPIINSASFLGNGFRYKVNTESDLFIYLHHLQIFKQLFSALRLKLAN